MLQAVYGSVFFVFAIGNRGVTFLETLKKTAASSENVFFFEVI